MIRVFWFILGLLFRPAFRRRVSALVLRRCIRALYLERESMRLRRDFDANHALLGIDSGLCSLLESQIAYLFPWAAPHLTIRDVVLDFGVISDVLRFGGIPSCSFWWGPTVLGRYNRLAYFKRLCSLSGVDYALEAGCYRCVRANQRGVVC